MSENSEKTTGGLSLMTIIFLIFLTLKLGGWGIVATWSWWWVFSPYWLPISVIMVFAFIIFIISKILD